MNFNSQIQSVVNDMKEYDAITPLLDCINRPFDYHPDGRVPDGNPNHTIQLIDYYDDNGVFSPAISNATSITYNFDAVGVYYTYGQNIVRSQTYDLTTMDVRTGQDYGPIYFFLSADGSITPIEAQAVSNPSVVQTASFWSNDPVNMNQILGANTGSDTNTSLTTALRLLSAGIRLWPTIELVTDSSTLAVSRYYGCSIAPSSVENALSDSSNFYTVMRNSPAYTEFTNSQGISGRVNPLQEGSPLNMMALNGLQVISDTNFDLSGMYFPCLVARLTSQVSDVNANNQIAFPVRSFFRTVLEGSLTQPTPLQATRVPYEPGWQDKVHHFSYRSDLYPVIVSGHSFKNVSAAIARIMGKNREMANILNEARSALSLMKKTYNAGRTVANALSQPKSAKGKQKKKAAKKQIARYVKKQANVLGNNLLSELHSVAASEIQKHDRANSAIGPLARMVATV